MLQIAAVYGEFKGWNVQEQIDFSLKLFDVFRKHPLHIHSFDIPLQLLVKEIPETAENPVGFAYVILLFWLMRQISEETLRLYPNEQISLHHDHTDQDGALADAFRIAVDDPKFPRADQYSSITSENWQHCIMLQPADMIAFENFKEGMQLYYPNPKIKGRRKSLKALLDLESISGRANSLGLDSILLMRKQINELDEKAKRSLFDAARIHA